MMLVHPESKVPGVWEPTWSAANGTKYTLELEKKAKEDDLIINYLNTR